MRTRRAALSATRIEVENRGGALVDLAEKRGFGDGLPIVAPDEATVGAFVDAAGRAPAETIAILPPRRGVATVEKVAINAVMAGCRAVDLPVVLAAVEAFADPGFNPRIIQATSNPAGALVFVNGPVRRQIDLNVGANCMGGGRPNAAIGRALRLVMQNIGGAVVGTVDKAPHGFPGKISFCFGENEEESPWSPLHVDRGFAAADSVATVLAAHGTANIVIHGRHVAEDLLPELAFGMISAGASNYAQGSLGHPMLVLTPNIARALDRDGITKTALQDYLFEHAVVPLEWYPPHARRSGDLDAKAVNGGVRIAQAAADIVVVVAGSSGTHATFIPTYADSVPASRVVRAPTGENRPG